MRPAVAIDNYSWAAAVGRRYMRHILPTRSSSLALLVLTACANGTTDDETWLRAPTAMVVVIDPLTCSTTDRTIARIGAIRVEGLASPQIVLLRNTTLSTGQRASILSAFRLPFGTPFILRSRAHEILGSEPKSVSIAYFIRGRRVWSETDTRFRADSVVQSELRYQALTNQ